MRAKRKIAGMEITEYSPATVMHLAAMWVPWLKQMTGKAPESEDVRAVSNPEAFYIQTGGMVYFAQEQERVVGCVAIKKLSDDVYEFCKLVVTDSARGNGAGRKLVETCIDFARKKPARQLVLQTFHLSALAIEMYYRIGFKVITPPVEMHVLERTEIVMGIAF